MHYLSVIAALLMLVPAISSRINTERQAVWEAAAEESGAGQLMHYVRAFDDYRQHNTGADGDVTGAIIIPAWMPKNGAIKTVIASGTGYVYTPAEKGMLREVLKLSENSSAVGVSDSGSIITLSGKISKPPFIPSGFIVYIR